MESLFLKAGLAAPAITDRPGRYLAMGRLKETRAEDEEIVAIVETDACCVDAVQVLTGCTFGNGCGKTFCH